MSRGDKKPFETAVFFPSASRVQVPFVGDRRNNVKLVKPTFAPLAKPQNKRKERIGKKYIENIFDNVDFDVEVVKERSSKSLKYDKEQIDHIYSANDVVLSRVKPPASGGRFNTRGYIKKLPSHIKTITIPDSNVRKYKDNSTTERLGGKLPEFDITDQDGDENRRKWLARKIPGRSRPATISPAISVDLPPPADDSNIVWDEHVIHQLSKDTARWIVFENVNQGSQKERLNSLITDKFGYVMSNPNLVREEVRKILRFFKKIL